MPVLLFGAPPRPFSAVGAILGLAVPGVPHDVRTRGGPRRTERTLWRMPLHMLIFLKWMPRATLAKASRAI
jgi:hypothetical protein